MLWRGGADAAPSREPQPQFAHQHRPDSALSWSTVRIFLRSLSEYRDFWRIWVPLLTTVVLLPPIVLAMPLVEKQLVDGILLSRRLELLPQIIGLYAGLWLVSSAVSTAGVTLRTYLAERFSLHLRNRVFTHCEALSLAFSHREHSGRVMALFANDVPAVLGLFTALVVVLGSLVGLAFGVAVMFSLSWQLALVAGVLPPLVAGVATVLTRPFRPAARAAQDKAAELTERLQDNLGGLREVVAFGRESVQTRQFTRTLQELLRLRMRLTLMETGLQTGQSLFSLTVTLVMLGFGGYLVIDGQITLGTLVAMRAFFGSVFQPATLLAGTITAIQKSLASADRLYAFLDEQPRVREREGVGPPEHLAGEVRFDRVNFGYRQGRPVLRDVSFTARPGEVVAMVGPSGAGKSTLASLIARFYDPDEGSILLDGVNLRDLSLDGLRKHIGMVFQDTYLFATTIRENIAFGRDGAREDEIVAAARGANAWEFIERLPAGLDTQVGERGVELSEGQKQRIAIARALLRNPKILILDEPTSALDARSEHLLQLALENLMRGRTTFVIAHRLATVKRADRILVVDGGRVVEQGTHDELLLRGGLYHELHELQVASPAA
jgi:ATP-binding cassette, subfamily B, bacterial MsbA